MIQSSFYKIIPHSWDKINLFGTKKHLFRDVFLADGKKKENQIEKLPLYLEKLLKLSILKSNVGQSDNVLEKGALKSFILPTMFNSLMKIIASARSRNQA